MKRLNFKNLVQVDVNFSVSEPLPEHIQLDSGKENEIINEEEVYEET